MRKIPRSDNAMRACVNWLLDAWRGVNFPKAVITSFLRINSECYHLNQPADVSIWLLDCVRIEHYRVTYIFRTFKRDHLTYCHLYCHIHTYWLITSFTFAIMLFIRLSGLVFSNLPKDALVIIYLSKHCF